MWNAFFQISLSCCSFILNTLLILLILMYSPPKMGMYKYLMIYIAVFEEVYSLWGLISEPKIHSIGSAFVVFRDMRRSSCSMDDGVFLIVIYCGFFGFSQAIFGIHFIYRYGAIDKEFWRKYISGYKIYALFSLPLVYFVVWAFVCFYFFPMTEQTDEYIGGSILKNYDLKIDDISYVCFLFYPIDENKEMYPDWTTFVAVSVCWFEIATSMFAVFYFGVKCFLKIRKALHNNGTVSQLTKNLQQQLFQALVVQTCIPLILMYIPPAILLFFPMINYDIGAASSLVTIAIAIYPAIDPLPNIFIIKSYRRAVQDFFKTMFLFCTTNARHAQCTHESAVNVCGGVEMESIHQQAQRFIIL